jgi:hypothetical protein
MKVKDITNKELQFVSDSQDVNSVKENLLMAGDYDSFFVGICEGDYTEVYGMYGIVPYLEKDVYPLTIHGK